MSEDGVVYKKYLAEDSSSSDSDSDEDEKLKSKSKNKKTKKQKTKSKYLVESEEEDDDEDDDKEEAKEESEEEEKDKPVEFPTESILNNIKNKMKLHATYRKMKKEKQKAKKELKELKKRECEILGKKLKKKIPHTIESKRVMEEDLPENDDEDILHEEATDKYAPFYAKSYEPKVLITTSDKIHGRTIRFMKELALTIPNSKTVWRNTASVKRVVALAKDKGYTDILIINEDHRIPVGLLLIHLPEGPTAYFKLSNVKACKDLKRKSSDFTGHRPELILNNFKTQLGRTVARMIGALYHYDPEFKGRSACTFHNQRDYIFFRHHRYEFKNAKKVSLRELGPSFTMRLEWIKDGTFDGDYEWILKRHEMETSRRKFNL